MKFTNFAVCPSMVDELRADSSFKKNKFNKTLESNFNHINNEFLRQFDVSESILLKETPLLNNQLLIAKGMGLG